MIAIFRMMASRVTLDSQGRLVHRENGKLILPFEHFANAVMLKHMNRPHSMHLNTDATVRAVGAYDYYFIALQVFGDYCMIAILLNCYRYWNPTQ